MHVRIKKVLSKLKVYGTASAAFKGSGSIFHPTSVAIGVSAYSGPDGSRPRFSSFEVALGIFSGVLGGVLGGVVLGSVLGGALVDMGISNGVPGGGILGGILVVVLVVLGGVLFGIFGYMLHARFAFAVYASG